MNQIEFEVGGRYENMKGIYEVLSIGDDTMLIRWENGEEATTEIDFQKRIIERMDFEKRQGIEKKARKAQKADGGRGKFEGLTENDFSRKVSGTTWRRRSCLGGAVKVFPESDRHDLKSWSIARKPMIHWADAKHRNPGIFDLQSKFFVRLSDDKLFCGYCIERPGKTDDGKGDWDAFLAWLKEEQNERKLKEIAFDRSLVVYQFNKDGEVSWKIRPVDDKWMIEKKGSEKPLESLHGFLEDFSSAARRMDLQIAKAMDKEDVIAKGIGIAEDISRVFENLFPLYEASLSNGSHS